MFLRGHHLLLSGKLLERANHSETSVPGLDDIIDIALLGGLVGIVEQILALQSQSPIVDLLILDTDMSADLYLD